MARKPKIKPTIEVAQEESKSTDLEKEYKVSLSYLGEVKSGEYFTIAEALMALGPKLVKNRVIITATRNGRTVSRILFAPHARRIFFNKVALSTFAHNFQRALP